MIRPVFSNVYLRVIIKITNVLRLSTKNRLETPYGDGLRVFLLCFLLFCLFVLYGRTVKNYDTTKRTLPNTG